LIAELRNGKKLKEAKLADGSLKYKQSWVYVPHGKLILLVLKDEKNSPIALHRKEKTTATISRKYY
jgi:hypothetical protein